MKALIDGDILVYRSGFGAEHTYYDVFESLEDSYEPGPLLFSASSHKEMKSTLEELDLDDYIVIRRHTHEPVENCLYSIKNTINYICDALGADRYEVILSKGKCFRHNLSPTYKANRKNMPRPVWYNDMREYLHDHHGAVAFSSVEADDVLGMLQSDDTVICSIDKDLLQIPGSHFNWVHWSESDGKVGKYEVSPLEGALSLWKQALTGDSVDNIEGIYRMGPKTAAKLMDHCTTEEEMKAVAAHEWGKFVAKAAESEVSAEALMETCYRLVKIGGPDAEAALNESGEIETYKALQVGLGKRRS
jgi:hypothetical protein